MIRGMDSSSERLLASLDKIDARLQRAERELTSGKRLATPSDSPDEVSRTLLLRAALEGTVQTGRNLARVKTEVDTAERALATAITMLDDASRLGVQAATETLTAEARRTAGSGVRAVLEQLVNIAATAVEGRYVFSGDNDGTAPYSLDLTAPNGVSAYQGAASTREIAHPAGTRFAVARTAQDIFDAAGASVFAAVNALRVALENGPVEGDPNYQADYAAQTVAIRAALEDLRTAKNHAGVELGGYGTMQTRISEAVDFARKLETRQRVELSSIEDADATQAVLDLDASRLHRETALSARARMPQGSLFDYIG